MAELILTTKEELQEVVSQSVKNAIAESTPPPPDPDLRTDPYTKIEVCRLFKVALPTLDRWNKRGQLKSFKIGRRVYYAAADVHRKLNSENV